MAVICEFYNRKLGNDLYDKPINDVYKPSTSVTLPLVDKSTIEENTDKLENNNKSESNAEPAEKDTKRLTLKEKIRKYRDRKKIENKSYTKDFIETTIKNAKSVNEIIKILDDSIRGIEDNNGLDPDNGIDYLKGVREYCVNLLTVSNENKKSTNNSDENKKIDKYIDKYIEDIQDDILEVKNKSLEQQDILATVASLNNKVTDGLDKKQRKAAQKIKDAREEAKVTKEVLSNWVEYHTNIEANSNEQNIKEILLKNTSNKELAEEMYKDGDFEFFEDLSIRKQNFKNTKVIYTREELHQELGNDLAIMVQSATKTDDGNYDLTKIKEILEKAFGIDYRLNAIRFDRRNHTSSELSAATNKLNMEIFKDKNIFNKKEGISTEDTKKLYKLFGIKEEKGKTNLFKGTEKATLNGALTALGLSFVEAEATSTATAGTIAYAHAYAHAFVGGWATLAIAALPLINTLVNLIVGDGGSPEESCFDYRGAKDKSFEEYVKYIEVQPYTDEKKEAIIALAGMFATKYPEDWSERFIATLDEAAGNDPILNCEEFKAASLILAKELEDVNPQEEEHTEPVVIEEEIKPGLHYIVDKEEQYENYDGRKKSWQVLVTGYDCLDNQINDYRDRGIISGKDNYTIKVRLLKLAQCITDNDYNDERMIELLKASLKGVVSFEKYIKDHGYDSWFNFETYYNKDKNGKVSGILMSGVINDLRLPKKLLGCDLNIENIDNTKATKGNGGNGNYTLGNVSNGQELYTSDDDAYSNDTTFKIEDVKDIKEWQKSNPFSEDVTVIRNHKMNQNK